MLLVFVTYFVEHNKAKNTIITFDCQSRVSIIIEIICVIKVRWGLGNN